MVAKYIAAKEATIVGQVVADSHIVEMGSVEEKGCCCCGVGIIPG